MTKNLAGEVGFGTGRAREPACRRSVAALQLVAAVTLALSTVVAATAVSVGIARAGALDAAAQGAAAAVVLQLSLPAAGMPLSRL